MRIDAHHHVWDLSVRDQPWTRDISGLHRSFDLAELRPQLTANDIDATVVVQTVTVADETPELLALAEAEPVIAGVVGWVDLTAADVADQLAALRDLPGGDRLVGIRHQVQQEHDPGWLLRTDVANGLHQIAAAGLNYDLLIIPEQFPAAIEVVAKFPELRFVLDHGGKPEIVAGRYDEWYEQVSALAELPNVAVKASGLVTEAEPQHWTKTDIEPYLRTMIAEFGPERVMFGSDWPVCTVAGGYQPVVELAQELTEGLSASERESFFADTARTWYRLPVPDQDHDVAAAEAGDDWVDAQSGDPEHDPEPADTFEPPSLAFLQRRVGDGNSIQ